MSDMTEQDATVEPSDDDATESAQQPAPGTSVEWATKDAAGNVVTCRKDQALRYAQEDGTVVVTRTVSPWVEAVIPG